MDVFEFEDYRAFIHHQIEQNRTQRGYRSRLAEAAGCRLSYLSQVLGERVQLTPDQAAGLCALWELEPERTDYFLALVNLERAGAPALKAAIRRQLKQLKDKHQENVRRASDAVVLPLEQLAQYHSGWHRMALHALVSIEAFQTVPAIAQRFRLSPEEVQHYLWDLERMGLVRRVGERWLATDVSTMTPAASPLSNMTHTNWRLRAIDRLGRREPSDLHYSSAIALSRQDLLWVRRQTMAYVNQLTQSLEQSVPEECVALLVDLFVV